MQALVMIADGIEELETVTITDLLVRGGIEVILASVNGLTVRSARGLLLTADCLVADLAGLADEYDVVICPGGGQGAQALANSQALATLLQERHQKQRFIAAICASPAIVLGEMGILHGQAATCFPSLADRLPGYINQDVVETGHITTSQGPATAAKFALSIIRRLQGQKVAQQVAKDALYSYQSFSSFI